MLGSLGGASNVLSINANGVAAGWSVNGAGVGTQQFAVVWHGNTPTQLATLGGTTSFAIGINNSELVVGTSELADNSAPHAMLWNGTQATDLGTLGGTDSRAISINNAGQIVGFADTATGNAQHATLWNASGQLTDLNSFLGAGDVAAGWVLTAAYSVNHNGWIVGTASNAALGITSEAYVLSIPASVPEPATWSLAILGCLMLTGTLSRRRRT